MQTFFKRHPEVRERIGQPPGCESAVLTKDALRQWFQRMKLYLDTIDPTLLTSPDRIFNADESGLNVCLKTKKNSQHDWSETVQNVNVKQEQK